MKEIYETCHQHETEFVEEAEEKHSDSLRPAVNGNCSECLQYIMLVNTLWKCGKMLRLCHLTVTEQL